MDENEKKENELESGAEELINNVLAESPSQQDRENLDATRDFNLVNLLNNQLLRAQTKNALKNTVIERITERVNREDDTGVSTTALIRLLEILDKGDTDLTLAVINAGKDMSFMKALAKGNEDKGVNMTKEDLELIKKLVKSIGFLETLQKKEGE